MTNKTKFSKEDFSKILSNYNLGLFRGSRVFTSGTVQTNILVKTTEGKFVLRAYEQSRSLKSISFEVNLINYLKKHDYPCPTLFRTKRGKFIGVYKNKPYAIFEFVEGEHVDKPSDIQKKQLVKRVAELQNITKDYRPSYKKYRWNYSIELCKKLAKKEAKKIGTINAKEKLKWLNSELSKLKLPRSLPKGICHCDFYFSNVLFRNNKFKALIDFDDANYTYLIFDLASLITSFLPSFEWNTWNKFNREDKVFDFREAKKIVSEYLKYRKLNNNEKKYLFDVHKLSILLDCVWYFKRGQASDFYEKRKIDYLNNFGRERFYQEIFG